MLLRFVHILVMIGTQHTFVGRQTIGWLADRTFPNHTRKGAVAVADGADNPRGYFMLDGENRTRRQVTFIALRPYMTGITRVEQRRGHAYGIGIALNASLDDITDAKFTPNFTYVYALSLVRGGTGARDDQEILESAEFLR